MSVKATTKDVDRSALILPQEAALVIVDEHARLLPSEAGKPWWRGRPYEPVVDLAVLFDVPYVIYLTLAGTHKEAERGPSTNRSLDTAIVSTQINPWRESAFAETVEAVGRPKILVSGHCMKGGITFAVLDALLRGFDVGYVADTTADLSCVETGLAFQRMVQAGAVPLSWRQLALEWQTDWANEATRARVIELARL